MTEGGVTNLKAIELACIWLSQMVVKCRLCYVPCHVFFYWSVWVCCVCIFGVCNTCDILKCDSDSVLKSTEPTVSLERSWDMQCGKSVMPNDCFTFCGVLMWTVLSSIWSFSFRNCFVCLCNVWRPNCALGLCCVDSTIPELLPRSSLYPWGSWGALAGLHLVFSKCLPFQ